MQIELVFAQRQFTNDSPIVASARLRNMTTNAMELLYFFQNSAGPIDFKVTHLDSGVPATSAITILDIIGSVRRLRLKPNEEKVFEIDLRKLFHLSADNYLVEANLAARLELTRTNVYAHSKGIAIEVVSNYTQNAAIEDLPRNSVLGWEKRTRVSSNVSQSRNADASQLAYPTSSIITPRQRYGAGILAGLLAVTLAIVWRAALRNRKR